MTDLDLVGREAVVAGRVVPVTGDPGDGTLMTAAGAVDRAALRPLPRLGDDVVVDPAGGGPRVRGVWLGAVGDEVDPVGRFDAAVLDCGREGARIVALRDGGSVRETGQGPAGGRSGGELAALRALLSEVRGRRREADAHAERIGGIVAAARDAVRGKRDGADLDGFLDVIGPALQRVLQNPSATGTRAAAGQAAGGAGWAKAQVGDRVVVGRSGRQLVSGTWLGPVGRGGDRGRHRVAVLDGDAVRIAELGPFHEVRADAAAHTSGEVLALRALLAEVRARRSEAAARADSMEELVAAAHAEADRRRWCGEFDDFMDGAGLPRRATDHRLQVTATITVTVTVRARSAEEAVEALDAETVWAAVEAGGDLEFVAQEAEDA